MTQSYREFSPEFRLQVVRRIEGGERVSRLHHELNMRRSILCRWRDACRKEGVAGVSRGAGLPRRRTPAGAAPARRERRGGSAPAGGRTGAQDRAAGGATGFFRQSLQASQAFAPSERQRWRDSIYQEIRGMIEQEDFSVAEACHITGVSRAGFYRHYEAHKPLQAGVELRDALQKIAVENRCYGYRRVIAQLRHQGWTVDQKRSLRPMRAGNLLALRQQRYVLTTQSHHPFAIHPNLARRLVVDGINQLWVADITYIRLRETFLGGDFGRLLAQGSGLGVR